MIDIHCHILPGLDDGVESLAEATLMARMALFDGITTVVASAHMTPGIYDNTPDQIVEAAQAFGRHLKEMGMGLTILPGADIRITSELMNGGRHYLCINRITPYLLLEFPHDLIPPGSERLMGRLREKGLIPIITHPERNLMVQRRPGLLEPFLDLGCVIQVTAMSITGEFGPSAKQTVERLLKEGWVHVIATDAHDTVKRPPHLSRAVQRAAELVGMEAAQAMVTSIPEQIVRGMRIH